MIVAGGPSVGEIAPIIRGCGARILAVNLAFMLFPDADMLYAADSGFWHVYFEARNFAGYKLSAEKSVRDYGCGINVVEIERDRHDRAKRRETLSPAPFGTIGSGGGNSGFQALNIAAQLGARRIALAGLDFVGGHWHAEHTSLLRTASQKRLAEWGEKFDAAAATLRQWNVKVVNLSSSGILREYPYVAPHRFASDPATATIQA